MAHGRNVGCESGAGQVIQAAALAGDLLAGGCEGLDDCLAVRLPDGDEALADGHEAGHEGMKVHGRGEL